jgi:hypothetical protein
MGILAEVLALVSEVGRGLVTRMWTQGMSARSRAPCGAPPALVLLLAVVVASPLTQ